MIVLALDAATIACSAAVMRDGAIVARRLEMMARGQAEALMPMVRDVAGQANIGFGTIDLIAVTIGPGGFTGVRIGLAAARGLALATGAACLGVTTFEAIAAGVDDADGLPLLIALDSKRGDFYGQTLGAGGVPLTPPSVVTADGLRAIAGDAALVVAGDAAAQAAAVLRASGLSVRTSARPGYADAARIARLAADRWDGRPGPPPEPLYLRPPDAALPQAGGRRRP